MMSTRDRVLAALFALQVVAAAVFAITLTNIVDRSGGQTVVGAVTQEGSGLGTDVLATEGTSGAPAGGVDVSSGTGADPSATAVANGPGAVAAPGQAAKVEPGAPIKIGAIVSQTGAINFAASAQGTKAYLDRVNQNGGVNGHQIVLDLRDDQLDAARGRQQAQALVAEGVFAFAGWNAPLTEENIVPFLEQNKIPLIGGYGTRPEYKSPYAYIIQSGHYGFEMGRFLGQEQKVTRPGVIFIGSNSDAANTLQRRAFTEGVAAAGKKLDPSDIAQVDVTKVSYDDIITRFRFNGVNGIATLVDQTAYNRLQQAMDRQNYAPVHVADPLFTDPTVKQGPTTAGTLVASDFAFVETSRPNAEVQDYLATVRARYGSRAQTSYIGLSGWIDAKILVEAIKRMGSTITRVNLRTVMESMPSNIAGPLSAPLFFGPAPHDINRCLQLGKVANGLVEPYKTYACDNKIYG